VVSGFARDHRLPYESPSATYIWSAQGRVIAPIVMCNSTLSLSTPGTAPHFMPSTPKSRRLIVNVV